MPHLIKGKKAKNAVKGKAPAGVYKRQRLLGRLNKDLSKWNRVFLCLSIILIIELALIAGITIRNQNLYPGRVFTDTVISPDRGTDYISLNWDESRNTDVYRIWIRENDAGIAENGGEGNGPEEYGKDAIVDDSWDEYETNEPQIMINGLKEGASYAVVVRAENEKKNGISTGIRVFTTKKHQSISVEKTITKFSFSEPFAIDADAKTPLIYESSDPEVAVVDSWTNLINITGPGKAEIKVKAAESKDYEQAEKTVNLEVIESKAVSAGGASARIIYHLDSNNCEVVKTVTGADGAVIPQGLAYTGDKYIIAYGMGSPDRMISFDVNGDGKDVSVPKVSIGHPNGLAYADESGLCYCATGWTSKVYTYEPATGVYGIKNLSYGLSGVGYDRKEKLLYTCSRTAMVAYDISDGYSVKYKCGVVRHSGYTYTQDCGGHAGIMFRCLSGSSKHGTNYIDLYDMKNGRYLGTISCELSEVESCIVDNDGFLEILANNSSRTDYIWKTNLNIDTLGEGL